MLVSLDPTIYNSKQVPLSDLPILYRRSFRFCRLHPDEQRRKDQVEERKSETEPMDLR
jgi:hypothetical protein